MGMKRIITSTVLAIIIFGLISCTQNLSENTLTNNESPFKKETTYYWYNGEKIPLTISDKYFNIIGDVNSKTINNLLSFNITKTTKIDSNQLTVQIIDRKQTDLTHSVSYSSITSNLKAEFSDAKVLPFIECENSDRVIGTSDLFYVKTREGDSLSLKNVADSLKLTINSDVPYSPDWYVISILGSPFNNVFDASNSIFETGLFEAVDPAFILDIKPLFSVNDPYYPDQWGLKNRTNSNYDINVENAWSITRGQGISIAIVDQGVDPQQADLFPNFDSISYDAQTGTSQSVFLGKDHGSHVSGIMTAVGNNYLQIIGVAPEAKLIRVSHPLTLSNNISAQLASGINWAWRSGADVINCSWGDQGNPDINMHMHSTILEESIINAMTKGRDGKGSIVVFASGNQQTVDYPGNFDDRIITVGSIDSIGVKSRFSGFGNKLDCMAPGENILSTLPYNRLGRMSGTSMAAPHVSGTVALMLAANPSLTRDEVERIIGITAKRIHPDIYDYGLEYGRFNGDWCQQMGYGLINSGSAVLLADLSKNMYLQTGGYSVGIRSLAGDIHFVETGSISQAAAANNTFIVGLEQTINNDFVSFYQILEPLATSAKPTIAPTNNTGGFLTFPPFISPGSRIKLRYIIMNGDTFVGAPTLTININ